jgi:ribosomal protein L5
MRIYTVREMVADEKAKSMNAKKSMRVSFHIRETIPMKKKQDTRKKSMLSVMEAR